MNAEDQFLIPLYQKFPVKLVRGSGASVFDESGKEYIDLSGGYGVAIVGHANPFVAEALSKQASRLITCHGSIYNDAREAYVGTLAKYLPANLSKVYLSNSGAEANEAAIKFARKATGRKNIIAFAGGYHGKTYGALSATWSQKYRKPFEPLVEGFKFSPYGNLEKAKELIDESVAAVIVEPIQGEGGIHVPPDDFLAGLREVTSTKGALLIFDEVQSGFGRTGKLWACENWSISPDIMTASKGIAGGVPFAFTATTDQISSVMKAGEHTSTFGGNPLACAAALAALEFLIRERILEKAVVDGAYFAQKLESLRSKHPSLIREVRGKGLMLAAELKLPVKEVIMKGFEHNLILLYAGLNILRFLPPLVITRSQIDTVERELDLILSEIKDAASTAEGVTVS
ncbi:MAG: aspartate aminotransferase family protein [Nitrososphaerota archaeon]|nr:aspartate aminotransferase family protein [Nitrososphaerota archaeon]